MATEAPSSTALKLNFRVRAEKLRNRAVLILALISALLILAGIVFYYAAEITKKDVTATEINLLSAVILKRMEEIKNEVGVKPSMDFTGKNDSNLVSYYDDFKKFNIDFRNEVEIVNNRITSLITPNKMTKTQDIYDLNRSLKIFPLMIGVDIKGLNSNRFVPTLRVFDSSMFHSMLSENKDRTEKLQKIYDKMVKITFDAKQYQKSMNEKLLSNVKKWEQDNLDKTKRYSELESLFKTTRQNELRESLSPPPPTTTEQEISIPFLIQTSVTRFGPMLIILFFVSILVNLYRYNIRLAAFYDARADAIEMMELQIDPVLFEEIGRAHV